MKSKVYLQIEFTELETKALRKASELVFIILDAENFQSFTSDGLSPTQRFSESPNPDRSGHSTLQEIRGKIRVSILGLLSFFQNHGVCHLERQGKCALLHDVDYALDFESKHSMKRRKAEKRR